MFTFDGLKPTHGFICDDLNVKTMFSSEDYLISTENFISNDDLRLADKFISEIDLILAAGLYLIMSLARELDSSPVLTSVSQMSHP